MNTYKGETYEATKYRSRMDGGNADAALLEAALVSNKIVVDIGGTNTKVADRSESHLRSILADAVSKIDNQTHIHFGDGSWLSVTTRGENNLHIDVFTPTEDKRPNRPLEMMAPETATIQ